MIGRTNAGGGRGKLDFRVMSGLSAPANPRRNDIWIKSDIPVTNVLLSTIDGWADIRGAVNLRWDSATYSDSKNQHYVGNLNGLNTQAWTMPTACKISDGSKLVNAEAYIWRGQWVQFSETINYVYNEGVERTDVYGEFILRNATKQPTYISLAAENSGTAHTAYASTGNSVDLSKATKVTAVFDFTHAYATPNLVITSIKPNLANTSIMLQGIQASVAYPSTGTGANKTLSLDVTNISSGWIVFSMANTTSANLKKLWIE